MLPRLGIVFRVMKALNLTSKRDLLPLLECQATESLFFPDDALVDPRDVMRALHTCCLGQGVVIREETRVTMGVGADARAFLFTRPYCRGSVKVTLDDRVDPTPYWLLSSRR